VSTSPQVRASAPPGATPVAGLHTNASAALEKCYDTKPGTRKLGEKVAGVLVFPEGCELGAAPGLVMAGISVQSTKITEFTPSK